MGPRWDLLAWNEGARRLLADFAVIPPEERNILWLLFARQDIRPLVVDWEARARRVLANFRAESAPHVGDPSFDELIDGLKRVSPEFQTWWDLHEVVWDAGGRREFDHPIVGRLALEMTAFFLHDAPDLRLVVYTPLADGDSAEKLRRLLG